MRVAEVVVPAVLMALVGGPRGVVYLLCLGLVKARRRRRRIRLRRHPL
jgi:hypothetical protein